MKSIKFNPRVLIASIIVITLICIVCYIVKWFINKFREDSEAADAQSITHAHAHLLAWLQSPGGSFCIQRSAGCFPPALALRSKHLLSEH